MKQNILTIWHTVLLEKLAVVQLPKKTSASYGKQVHYHVHKGPPRSSVALYDIWYFTVRKC